MEPGVPITNVSRPRNWEQLILETIVMLNSRSFTNDCKSGAFAGIIRFTSILLFEIISYSNLMQARQAQKKIKSDKLNFNYKEINNDDLITLWHEMRNIMNIIRTL